MKTQSQHTPTPWSIEKGMSLYSDALPYFIGRSLDGKMTPFQTAGTRAEANAAFIVRAVNCYQEMLDTLKLMDTIACPSHGELRKRVRQAIAKAEGK